MVLFFSFDGHITDLSKHTIFGILFAQ